MIKAHELIKKGCWFAGGAWSWNGYSPLNKFSIDATKAALNGCIKNGVSNFVFTMWGDDTTECSRFALLPTLFYNILKIHNEWMRYVFLTIIVFQSGLQYAVLSYHTIIMLVFPLIIACLYNKKKYVYFAAMLSVPMIVISHLASTVLRVVPDEPLVAVDDVVFFGILPRLIEFLGIAVVCVFISDRIENLVKTLGSKNSELYADQENLILSLSQIIENKSENTGQHVKRVAEYTQLLCQSLGYSEEDSWKISLAAMMHDVGKIMVPETIWKNRAN
jgi:hypothetical protein